MKLQLGLLFVCSLVVCAGAQAGTYMFVPSPANLNNLEHEYAYQWAITWTTSEIITGATLRFEDITNELEPEIDRLAVYLLQNKNTAKFLNVSWQLIGSNSYSQSYSWYDNENTGKPFNDATWPTVKNQTMYPQIPGYPADGYWRDTNGSTATDNVDFVFDAQDIADLTAWSADGDWALGLDGDSHYFNSGITLTITTRPVPEPSSLLALGIGALGLAGGLRWRRR